MRRHRASEGAAELRWGSTLMQEPPGVRQSYSCVALRRRRLSVICKTHNMSTVRLYLWLDCEIYLSFLRKAPTTLESLYARRPEARSVTVIPRSGILSIDKLAPMLRARFRSLFDSICHRRDERTAFSGVFSEKVGPGRATLTKGSGLPAA